MAPHEQRIEDRPPAPWSLTEYLQGSLEALTAAQAHPDYPALHALDRRCLEAAWREIARVHHNLRVVAFPRADDAQASATLSPEPLP